MSEGLNEDRGGVQPPGSVTPGATGPSGGAQHPIGVVATRTGLTPDVLRVWERRYGVVAPQRTPSGQRLYSDADVERLRLLQRATSHGRNISQLAGLDVDALRHLVVSDEEAGADQLPAPGAPTDAGAWVVAALERTVRLDASGLEQLLRRLAAMWGTVAFLEDFAAPFFLRIGEEWHEGGLKPAHEHLASAVMRTVLASLVSDLSAATSAPRLLVATPADERHEIGALLVAATAASAGWRVTYLGADLPAGEIADAAAQAGARAVALSVVLPGDVARLAAELRELRSRLPAGVELLVGGGGAPAVEAAATLPGIVYPDALPGLREWLRREV
jgi:MerR family transcriptional regulator, light-induced transcriptional regulator